MSATRWSARLLATAVLATGVTAAAPGFADQQFLVYGTASINGQGDGDAFVYLEQRVPAGARDAVYDDADGFWYSDGYDADVDDNGDELVYETVVTLIASDQEVDAALGPALSCVTKGDQTGGNRVGDTMSAVPGTFSTAPSQVTYQWYRRNASDPNDASALTRIDGARSSRYTLTDADLGSKVQVVVSGLGDHGNATCDATTNPFIVVPAPPRSFVPPPAIQFAVPGKPLGVAKVGHTVWARPLRDVPAGRTITYQWYRVAQHGRFHIRHRIRGATHDHLRLRPRDRGCQIFVQYEVSDPYYADLGTSSRRVVVR